MEKQLENLIARLRPIMQRDGGDVEFSGYDPATKTVSLTFSSADYHCPGANQAMQMLFEKKLRADFPELEQVRIIQR